MTDRIKNKIYKAFDRFNTDCCVGIIRSMYNKERTVIIIRTCNKKGEYDINVVGNTGINLLEYYYGEVLYVRDLQDIARTTIAGLLTNNNTML